MLNVLLTTSVTQQVLVSLAPIQWFVFFPSADVKRELDDLSKTMKNFETRVEFTKDLETASAVGCTSHRSHIA